ncbi:DNA repair protein RecO [Oceanobacillus sp. CAU 1775]
MLEKVEGIIIKTIDYGETNKIVTIFSKRFGKFTAMARGAKKPRSRMASVAQPFILGEFFVYMNRGMGTLQQGEIIDSFRNIREDIVKTAYTAYITELTEKLIEEKTPDLELYEQYYLTLKWIDENTESEIPIMMYELKLFTKGGFAPILHQCSNCGDHTELLNFSFGEGGMLCSRCKHIDPDAILLTATQVRLLQMFQNVGLDQVGNISVKEENKQFLRTLIDAYYERFGGFYLKSRRFLKQLDKLTGD